ncbi:hypothetical protein ACQ4WP_18015 [Janthinobacterium sp. GB4P2]|uniref:hypothetical protein n=1 Tax=Janthinobacterium sp. GB4P2 TaxID=3424189 RepID=UPI003F248904
MNDMRGKITEVIFQVEYPDGTSKISKFVPEFRLNAMLFSDCLMTPEMKEKFTVSEEDWKKNPAMIIVDGEILKANCDWPDCQQA